MGVDKHKSSPTQCKVQKNWELPSQASFSPHSSYSNSKLCCRMLASYWAENLPTVTVTSLDPGAAFRLWQKFWKTCYWYFSRHSEYQDAAWGLGPMWHSALTGRRHFLASDFPGGQSEMWQFICFILIVLFHKSRYFWQLDLSCSGNYYVSRKRRSGGIYSEKEVQDLVAFLEQCLVSKKWKWW